MRVVDDTFPATKGAYDFKLKEEWYSRNFAGLARAHRRKPRHEGTNTNAPLIRYFPHAR